jgi:ATP-dependent RNA helicase DHX29
MGKSKRAKKRYNDARGYGQQPTKSKAPSISSKPAAGVSKQTHENIQTLVDTLSIQNEANKNGKSIETAAVVIDSRFVSKLTNIVGRLLELGFTDDQLDALAADLPVSEWRLEGALDWLCLNVSTLDLPPLFTDGNLRDAMRSEDRKTNGGSDKGLTVLKFVAKDQHRQHERQDSIPCPPHNDDPLPPSFPKDMVSRKEQERKEQDEKEKAEQKARLLAQYAYDEEEYYSDDYDEEEEEHKTPETFDQAVVAPESLQKPQELKVLSAIEQEIQQKEFELKELEADLGSEANNYMRSKQEIKELQNQVKQLRKHIAGLARKVQKEKRQQEQEEMAATVKSETKSGNDDEIEEYSGVDLFGGGGFFDSAPESTKNDTSKEVVTAEEYKPLIDAIIPKAWTGTTPKKILDEICRKTKRGRPKFKTLPARAGYKLSLLDRPETKDNKEWNALEVDFARGSSLQDYLALQALYSTSPSMPLYRMFPPAFRDLWLLWTDELKEEKSKIELKLQAVESARIDRLVTIIQSKQGDAAITSGKVPTTMEESRDTFPELDKDWEDFAGKDDIAENMAQVTPTKLGYQLQQDFTKRQATHEYQQMLSQRQNLPVTAYRYQFLEAVDKHSVVILQADTGAGKSTQAPQFLLEDALSKGKGDQVNIICTQPRRVAAVSLAERIADETCVNLGDQVGFQIRMESKRSRNTKLLFCTTGVLLRRLQNEHERLLGNVTHIVIDEVHERQVQTDVLLIAVKQILLKRSDLKVILMSATMNSSLFSDFFNGAPVLKIPGRTFPVANYYLEDLLEATGHIIEEDSRYAIRNYHRTEKTTLWVTGKGGEKQREVADHQGSLQADVSGMYPGYSRPTQLSMDRVDENTLNYDLIEDVLRILLLEPQRNAILHAPDGADLTWGSVLIFLPGIGEIRALSHRLSASRELGNTSKFSVIPLHSKLSSSEQRKAFLAPKAGARKIIVATNIAETSVTISDVVVVIDCGRERELRRNKRTSTSILVTDWCSKASAKQRQGRAGRVQPGLCLKLFSSRKAESMKAVSEPELKRVPLEEVCLSILAGSMSKSCQEFLQQAPQPPDAATIQTALDVLMEVGAVQQEGTTLTSLGRHLAKLPVDVHLGKMLVMGSLFKCLDRVLTIAATLSSKSPFASSLNDGADIKAKHKQFHDPDSDFATLCNVFERYDAARVKSNAEGRAFCQSNYLNQGAMYDIRSLRFEFLNLLCSAGFVSKDDCLSFASPAWLKTFVNQNVNDWSIVHAVVCAGLWSNIAVVKESKPGSISLWKKDQEIFFHRSSVNASKKRFAHGEEFVCYFERFGTTKRESISTTCFVDPIPLLLFGGDSVVLHTERRVVIGGWLDIKMSAQVGVLLKRLRQQIDLLLQQLIDSTAKSMEMLDTIDNIVAILSQRG